MKKKKLPDRLSEKKIERNKEEKDLMRKVAKGTIAFYLTRAGLTMIAGGCLLLFTLGLFGAAMLILWAQM